MRAAVLSDIHSNWHAMSAALRDADTQGAEAIWCLGDVTGYGPAPFRCWQELAEFRGVPSGAWVAGNHDWGIIDRLEAYQLMLSLEELNGPDEIIVGYFGPHAWGALLKQRESLEHKPEVLESLNRLPVLASPWPGVYLTHGVFDADPATAIATYAKGPESAEESLTNLRALLPHLADTTFGGLARVAAHGWQAPRLMLVGHTHKACAWQPRNSQHDGARWLDSTEQLNAGPVWFEDLEKRPIFANPGSVGFPHDCTPGFATYMLVDWQETRAGLWLRRVKYDPAETIRAMRAMGISEVVVRQLEPRSRKA